MSNGALSFQTTYAKMIFHIVLVGGQACQRVWINSTVKAFLFYLECCFNREDILMILKGCCHHCPQTTTSIFCLLRGREWLWRLCPEVILTLGHLFLSRRLQGFLVFPGTTTLYWYLKSSRINFSRKHTTFSFMDNIRLWMMNLNELLFVLKLLLWFYNRSTLYLLFLKLYCGNLIMVIWIFMFMMCWISSLPPTIV